MTISPVHFAEQELLAAPAHNPPRKDTGAHHTWMRAVMADHGLTPVASKIGVTLAMFADSAGRCHPGYDSLATAIDTTKRTAMKAVALLEARGWIVVDRTSGIVNRYTLLRMPVSS
jgi:hypothetical protein